MDVIQRNNILRHIKAIDQKAFPKNKVDLRRYKSWAKYTKWFKYEPKVFVQPGFYCVYTGKYISSFAANRTLTYSELLELYRTLKAFYKKRIVRTSCRETTSLRLIRSLAYKGLIEYRVIKTKKWDKTENIISIEFRFL